MFLPTVFLASFVAVPGPDLEIRAGGRLSRSWWGGGNRSQGSTLAAYEQFYLVI